MQTKRTFLKTRQQDHLRAIKRTFLCLSSLRRISINHGTRDHFASMSHQFVLLLATFARVIYRLLTTHAGAGKGAGWQSRPGKSLNRFTRIME